VNSPSKLRAEQVSVLCVFGLLSSAVSDGFEVELNPRERF
jgi:hypothetical protein